MKEVYPHNGVIAPELSPEKPVLYFDMDGVLVDFVSGIERISPELRKQYADALDEVPGIFSLMDPMPGAVEAFNELAELFDVYLLSTASWENPSAWSDKLLWVKKHLGQHAYKRLTLTHNKHLSIGDFLIDDRLANGADCFTGEHIHFGQDGFEKWEKVTTYLKRVRNSDRFEHIVNYFLFHQDLMYTGCAANSCHDEYESSAARITDNWVAKGMSVKEALLEVFEYAFGEAPNAAILNKLVQSIEKEIAALG